MSEAASPISSCSGIKTAGLAASTASNAKNRTNMLVKNLRSRFTDRGYRTSSMLHHGYGEDNYEQNFYTDLFTDKDKEESPYMVNPT